MLIYVIIIIACTYMYMYIQYRSDAKYKAHVIYTCLHEEVYTEANTCLFTGKWVYIRRQTRLHEKAHGVCLTHVPCI